MISALLLAAVVAGQVGESRVARTPKSPHPAIDVSYVPHVNDRCRLGSWDRESPENLISVAWCHSTLERARQYHDSCFEKEADCIVSDAPDGYLVRAGTPVIVKERHTLNVLKWGRPGEVGVVKVQILEGEFRGRELFAIWTMTFRYAGDSDIAPQAKTPPNKRSGRRPAADAVPPDVKLVLTDLTVNPTSTGNHVKVDGRVRCTSDVALRGIRFTVSFEDREGKLVRSAWSYCDPDTLSPGDVGSITVMAESDARYAKVKIDFKDSQKAIPWVDRSGMNAHQ